MKLACRVSLSVVYLFVLAALPAASQERQLQVISDETFDQVVVGSETSTTSKLLVKGSRPFGWTGAVIYTDNYNSGGIAGLRMNSREEAAFRGGALYHIGPGSTREGAFAPNSTVLLSYETAGVSLAALNPTGGSNIRFYTGDDLPLGERMRITDAGEVLIGTRQPNIAGVPAKLVVANENGYSQLLMVFAHAEPKRFQGRVQLVSGLTGRPALRFGTYWCSANCDSAQPTAEVYNDTLTIHQNKVGINAVDPDATLVVGGPMRMHNAAAPLRGLRFGAEPNGFTLNGTLYQEVNTITPINVTTANTRSAVHFRSAVTQNGIRNDLDVVVDGNIAAKYQDVAEWVPSTDDLAPGTVVVLNPLGINEVMASRAPYDTAVAGVVSARPGLILGEAGANKEQIATTGRVKVKVDATAHPIAVGDLLVTGTRPGTAMVSTPIDVGGVKIHRPGTIIGKALEPLPSGEGEILVLLSMQ